MHSMKLTKKEADALRNLVDMWTDATEEIDNAGKAWIAFTREGDAFLIMEDPSGFFEFSRESCADAFGDETPDESAWSQMLMATVDQLSAKWAALRHVQTAQR